MALSDYVARKTGVMFSHTYCPDHLPKDGVGRAPGIHSRYLSIFVQSIFSPIRAAMASTSASLW